MTVQGKLSLEDIVDLRAYEREREEFRDRIIALKKIRRVAVGPLVTLLFESRDTIRFQIQEMARAERMLSDDQIRTELDIYNPLVPAPGELTATLFVELRSDDEMREWLPRLVGIERSVLIRLHPGSDVEEVRCVVDEAHAAQLTREDVTASVHYVRFELGPEQVRAFADHPVEVVVDHPAYHHVTLLGSRTKESLLEHLVG